MIDIYSISYPIGVKRYIRNRDNAPDIIKYLYEHAEPITCKSLCSVLNLPTKPTAPILSHLCSYGILNRQTMKRHGSTPVYSYSLNEVYRFKLNGADEKQQASAATGSVAA